MFSFRTTPLDRQQDMLLKRGKVAVLCNQTAWNPEKEEYLFESLYRGGNLARVFFQGETFIHLFPGMEGCEFIPLNTSGEESPIDPEKLEDIDALIVEYQDTGSRFDTFTLQLYKIFRLLHHEGIQMAVYVLDRENPCGRQVEGTIYVPNDPENMICIEGIPHRHGLTIGELANLFYSEIGAKFPLHIISYMVRSATQYMMPWSIPPSEGFQGLFTSNFYCGMKMLEGTDLSCGEGTSRPFELFGAPYLNSMGSMAEEIADPALFLRKSAFTPKFGKYAGELCYGYQMMPRPGILFHSVAFVIRLLKYVRERYDCADFSGVAEYVGDEVMMDYIGGKCDWKSVREHIKVEEQKWVRKAKRYMLYDEQISRVKSLSGKE